MGEGEAFASFRNVLAIAQADAHVGAREIHIPFHRISFREKRAPSAGRKCPMGRQVSILTNSLAQRRRRPCTAATRRCAKPLLQGGGEALGAQTRGGEQCESPTVRFLGCEPDHESHGHGWLARVRGQLQHRPTLHFGSTRSRECSWSIRSSVHSWTSCLRAADGSYACVGGDARDDTLAAGLMAMVRSTERRARRWGKSSKPGWRRSCASTRSCSALRHRVVAAIATRRKRRSGGVQLIGGASRDWWSAPLTFHP